MADLLGIYTAGCAVVKLVKGAIYLKQNRERIADDPRVARVLGPCRIGLDWCWRVVLGEFQDFRGKPVPFQMLAVVFFGSWFSLIVWVAATNRPTEEIPGAWAMICGLSLLALIGCTGYCVIKRLVGQLLKRPA